MTDILDLHRASPAERAEAFGNFHDIWGRGLPVEEHVRARLQNAKYDNAQWYVGCLQGRVVTACGCYAMQLCIDGEIEPAYALGEVHTLAEVRGRGFAPRLLNFVEQDQRAAGRTVSVLYSDIAPSYYERLGYVLCSCPQGWADPRTDRLSEAKEATLTPFDPARELSAMAELYERYHRQFPLWVARSPSYWQYLVLRNPEDEFHFVEVDGQRIGYVRAAATADEIKVRDFALLDSSDEAIRTLVAGVTALAHARRINRVGGWMPTTGVFREGFRISDRSRELTMIKPLVPRLAIRTAHREAGEHLHEIDHV
jgi:predicted N-acetyltransferase YhbS